MWLEPEKFYVSQREFVAQMSSYPLDQFLQPATFRKMIQLRMPDTAEGIQKSKKRVFSHTAAADERSNIRLLESKSRPKLEKYRHHAVVYEQSCQEMNVTLTQEVSGENSILMMASTKSQEENIFQS